MNTRPVSESVGALADQYSAAAAAYARHWAPVLRRTWQKLLPRLPLASATTLLDLGCGTGDLIRDLETFAPHLRVAGLDRATGMLREAAARAPLAAVVGDAARLPFGKNSFDVVTIVFMLHHVPDPGAVLAEARRVLRREGHAGVVVWGATPEHVSVAIWREELDRIGAPPDTRPAGLECQELTNTQEKLAALLNAAGFEIATRWADQLGERWTADRLLAMQLDFGYASRRLAAAEEPQRSECRSRAIDRIRSLPEADLADRAQVLFAVARCAA